MIKNFFDMIKKTFNDLDKKCLKIIKTGLKFCFLILLCSMAILVTYLFFLHNNFVYQIGLLVFQLSLYFAIDFIVSGIAIDSIKKQIL